MFLLDLESEKRNMRRNGLRKRSSMDDINKLPASRDEAIDGGELFYYTGLACRNGHLAKRYTSSGQCIECGRAKFRAKANRIKEARARRQSEEQTQHGGVV